MNNGGHANIAHPCGCLTEQRHIQPRRISLHQTPAHRVGNQYHLVYNAMTVEIQYKFRPIPEGYLDRCSVHDLRDEVNRLRHNSTNYEKILHRLMHHHGDMFRARRILHRRIYAAMADAYPRLRATIAQMCVPCEVVDDP